MGTRGRTSAASLQVVTPTGLHVIERPRPPADLTDEQADEWRAVANSLPADWFGRETLPMLAQYCRHVVASKRVAALVAQCEAGDELDLRDYDRLLKMQEREGRAITSLATKMRISQQSTYDKSKKKTEQVRKPWDA